MGNGLFSLGRGGNAFWGISCSSVVCVCSVFSVACV